MLIFLENIRQPFTIKRNIDYLDSAPLEPEATAYSADV